MDLKFSCKKSLQCDKTRENAISYLLKLGLSILFGDPLITRPSHNNKAKEKEKIVVDLFPRQFSPQ